MKTLGLVMVIMVPVGIILAVAWAEGGVWRGVFTALGIVGTACLIAVWTVIGLRLAMGG